MCARRILGYLSYMLVSVNKNRMEECRRKEVNFPFRNFPAQLDNVVVVFVVCLRTMKVEEKMTIVPNGLF